MIQILDGQGKGYRAGVSSESRLKVEATQVTLEHHANVEHGEAYNLLFDVTPTAGGCFLHMENDSTYDLICEGISIRAASNEILTIKIGETGTSSGGTSTDPANLNAGYTSTGSGTFETGTTITGLSGGRNIIVHYVPGGNETKYYNFDADVILPDGKKLTIYATTGSIQLTGHIVFHYKLT